VKIIIVGAGTEEFSKSLALDVAVEKVANKVKRPDTEVTITYLKKGLFALNHYDYASFHLLNEGSELRALWEAQGNGADALVIACYFDPSILAARGIVEIPVVGGGEASMHLACLMGEKFAIVVPRAGSIPTEAKQVAIYGVRPKLIDNRPIRPMAAIDRGEADPVVIIEDFRETARGCIEDGAEVIVLGCWGLTSLITASDIFEVDGVPLVDPCISALKFAEMLGDLKNSDVPWISRKLMYRMPPEEELKAVLKMFE